MRQREDEGLPICILVGWVLLPVPGGMITVKPLLAAALSLLERGGSMVRPRDGVGLRLCNVSCSFEGAVRWVALTAGWW